MALRTLLFVAMAIGAAWAAPAQGQDHDYSMLDVRPYNPATDVDPDLFIADWRESIPMAAFGSLIERPILTPLEGSDELRPERPGAVCTAVTSLSYATLAAGAATVETALNGKQAVLYVTGGTGEITAGGRTAPLRDETCVLIPEGLPFAMKATQAAPLNMYIVYEPTQPGFTPRRDLLVVDYAVEPILSTTGHWVNQNKRVLGPEDGLAVITGYAPILLDPDTMAQPHSHGPGVEEIWFAVEGDVNLLLGKQLRLLHPGTANKVPADGNTPHANINLGDKPVRLVWFMKNVPDAPTGKYSALDPNPLDRATEPDIDRFIAHWSESTQRTMFGSLMVRDIFTPLAGNDPIRPERDGAVLEQFSTLAHAILHPHMTTQPSTLAGEQLVFYVDNGTGRLKAGSRTVDLRGRVGVLVPPGIEFSIENTGDAPLELYLIGEPIPDGFSPAKEIVVKDGNTLPIAGTTGHWAHIDTPLFLRGDGFVSVAGMNEVQYTPMTIGQPHSHGTNIEEIWFVVRGDFTLMLGKELRHLTPGSAFKVPPTGKTPHANMNPGNETIKLFWIYKER